MPAPVSELERILKNLPASGAVWIDAAFLQKLVGALVADRVKADGNTITENVSGGRGRLFSAGTPVGVTLVVNGALSSATALFTTQPEQLA